MFKVVFIYIYIKNSRLIEAVFFSRFFFFFLQFFFSYKVKRQICKCEKMQVITVHLPSVINAFIQKIFFDSCLINEG